MKALEYIKEIFQWQNGWENEEHDRLMRSFIDMVYDRVLMIPAGTLMIMVEMVDPADLTNPIVLKQIKTATTVADAQVSVIRYIDDSSMIFSIQQWLKDDDEYSTVFYEVYLHNLLDCGNCYFEKGSSDTLRLAFRDIVGR